jgi:hypothetical protein
MMGHLIAPPFRFSLSALWASLALLIFMALGASSPASWTVLVIAGLMPPMIFLAIWNDGPPPTIAEVLRATEDHR